MDEFELQEAVGSQDVPLEKASGPSHARKSLQVFSIIEGNQEWADLGPAEANWIQEEHVDLVVKI